MAQKTQKHISVTVRTWERLEKQVKNSGYNTTSGLSQYILNKWCEEKENEYKREQNNSSE